MVKTQEELGHRVMSARRDERFTQEELAISVGVAPSVIANIETGQRMIDAHELVRIAKALRRPVGWFVTDPPPSVVSRRAGRGDVLRREDIQLESLAQDVEQLIEIGTLRPTLARSSSVDSIGDTERAALEARRAAGLDDDEPVWDLVRVVERLGLYAFVLDLDDAQTDGSYVALKECGVALINGATESGRRRFTIAHELGHHVLNDEYDPSWIVGTDATDREKIVNAFAIHFLLPRQAIAQRAIPLHSSAGPRETTIRIAAEYGVSWSAACGQLHRMGCLTASEYESLLPRLPRKAEYVELELSVSSDATVPLVPPGYAAAVLRALKKERIGSQRALELLHGTLHERDLPPGRTLTLEEMTAELMPLPD